MKVQGHASLLWLCTFFVRLVWNFYDMKKVQKKHGNIASFSGGNEETPQAFSSLWAA